MVVVNTGMAAPLVVTLLQFPLTSGVLSASLQFFYSLAVIKCSFYILFHLLNKRLKGQTELSDDQLRECTVMHGLHKTKRKIKKIRLHPSPVCYLFSKESTYWSLQWDVFFIVGWRVQLENIYLAFSDNWWPNSFNEVLNQLLHAHQEKKEKKNRNVLTSVSPFSPDTQSQTHRT